MKSKVIFRAVFVTILVILSVVIVQDDKMTTRILDSIFGETNKVWLPAVIYALAMYFLIVWMLFPLFPKSKKSGSQDKRAKQLIVVGLSYMFLSAQQNAVANSGFWLMPQYQPVTVINDLPSTSEQNLVVVNEVIHYISNSVTLYPASPIGDGGVSTNNQPQLSLGFVILAVVVVVLVVGVAYVAYKIINAMRNIINKRNKQEKDANPDSSAQSAGASNNSEQTIYAATFLLNVPYNGTNIVVNDYDRLHPLSVKFTPDMSSNSTLSSYIPPDEELVELTDYLSYYGLSTNMVDSASVNRIPTNSQNVISLHNGVIKINLDGITNRTQTFKYSYDLTNWITIGTISVPVSEEFRTDVTFGDGFSPYPDRGFWKVIGSQ